MALQKIVRKLAAALTRVEATKFGVRNIMESFVRKQGNVLDDTASEIGKNAGK